MGKRYWYLDFDEVGYNFRMTDAQAAVGLVQLRRLDAMNRRRREIAARYRAGLAGVRGLCPAGGLPDGVHAFHAYCVLVGESFPLNKEEFMWEMYTARRIKVWSHYMPVHLTSVYRRLGNSPGDCPVAEEMYQRYVSLPIHPRLTDEAVDYVISSIRELA